MSSDVGAHCGILERAVACGVEGAVLKHQILRVTQRVLARYVAVDEAQVLGVPPQILSVEHRVVHGDVLRLPERVLGSYARVAYLGVPHILEHILRVALQSVHNYVAAAHEGVGALVQGDVAYVQTVDVPESLVGIVYLHVLESEVLHLAEELRTVYHAVLHGHVIRIPDCRS